jgi:hypothetical protein
LKLSSLKAGSGLNNACFDTNGNLTSQSSACSGVSTSSVGLSLPADLSASPSTIPSSGTLTITRNSQSANTFLAGPANGVPASPTYRSLVAADIPNNAANTTGNAATATALANAPTVCAAGSYALGITLDFHFHHLLDNLPGSSGAFIHAGLNAMKTLKRTIPNG